MNLPSAVLTSTFGHGSKQPKRSAWAKLICLSVCSLVVGLLLSRSLPGMTSNGASISWLATATFVAQVATLISLCLSGGATTTSNKLNHILMMLPLKKNQAEFFMLLPSIAIALCSLTLVAPSLIIICEQAGLQPLFTIAAIGVGGWSAFGVAYAHKHRVLCLALGVLVLTSEYRLLGAIRNEAAWAIAMATVIGMLCLLALCGGRVVRTLVQNPRSAKRSLAIWLPNWSWFAKKYWRYPPLRRNFLVTVVLGLGLTIFVVKYRSLGSLLVFLPVQLFAAALSSDTRSIARPSLPPEIGGLKGVLYFMYHSTTTSLVAAVLAFLPLEVAAVVYSLPIDTLLASIISGVGIGLFAGTWFAPRANDASAQLAANLVCLCIAIGASRLPGLDHSNMAQYLLALVAILLAYSIEHKRNALVWRKHES